MSREQRALDRDRNEEEVDARLRRELQELEDEDERAGRVATMTKAKAASLMEKLANFKKDNVISASNSVISEPKPSPIGTLSILRGFVLFGHFSLNLLFRTLKILTCASLGSSPKPTFMGRKFTRFECVKTHLPDDLVEILGDNATNSILSKKTPEQKVNNRHYYVFRIKDVWAWIMQRLQLSLDIKVNIEDAYKSVLFRPYNPFL
jgi:hypothetical protein